MTGVNSWTSDGDSHLSTEKADALLQLFVVGRVLACVRRSRCHAEIEGLVELFDLCFVEGTMPSVLNTQVLRQLLYRLCGTSLSWMSEAEYLPDSLLFSAVKSRASDGQLSRCIETKFQTHESGVGAAYHGVDDAQEKPQRSYLGAVCNLESGTQQHSPHYDCHDYLDQASGSTTNTKAVVQDEIVCESSDEQIGEE